MKQSTHAYYTNIKKYICTTQEHKYILCIPKNITMQEIKKNFYHTGKDIFLIKMGKKNKNA